MIPEYLDSIRDAMNGLNDKISDLADEMITIDGRGNKLWLIGNGGSLAIAQHFAQDLVKLAGIRAQAMFCPCIVTAYSNDESFEMSYYKPLSVLASPDDLVLIFSVSGSSRNYIEFVSSFGGFCRIAAIVGKDGGFLAKNAAIIVHVKSNDYQICETAFCVIADLILRRILSVKGSTL